MIEAMKQALEALEECRRDPRLKYEHPTFDKAIASLRQAIADLESQEPVAWMNKHGACVSDVFKKADSMYTQYITPLYTHPPQRTWVDLTDEEIAEVAERIEASDPTDSFWRDFSQSIEAKLKQKNHVAQETDS
jgi:hypothetical protein